MHNRLISNLSSLFLYSTKKELCFLFRLYEGKKSTHSYSAYHGLFRSFFPENLNWAEKEISYFEVYRQRTGQLDCSLR